MNVEEIVTRSDLERMKAEIIDTILRCVKPTDMDALISLEQASELLGGMSPQTIRQKVCSGEIESHKAGGLKFTRRGIMKYIMATRRPANDEILARQRLM